ncbi:DMT family transporter [Candidatus Bathyarchaeota archaeon]|nr:DMT family transporter [Candidatus Bathyarchaeota archaeon]
MKSINLLLFLLLAILWGTGWSATKIALSYVPSPVFMLHRFIFSTITMSPVFLAIRKRVQGDTKTLKRLLLLCAINTFGVMVTNTGLEGESSGIGAVLTYTQPLFVSCLAVPFLGEKINFIKLIGTILGFIGVILLFLGKIHLITLISPLLLILGAFLWAVTVVYYKRFLSYVDSFVTNFFQWAFGIIPLGALNLFLGRHFFPQEPMYLWMVLYTSIGSATIGWTIWLYLLSREDVTVVSSSSFLIPLIAMFSGWVFLKENISAESLLGSMLVLLGVFLVNKSNKCNR